MEFSFEAPEGSRYLGGFLGKRCSRDSWVGAKVAAWAEAVRDLARVAVRHPQAALAGLTRSLQQEWLFVQRVVPGIQGLFAPVEEANAEAFIPILVGGALVDCRSLRCLMALPVKRGGMGLPNPVLTADPSYSTSVEVTWTLTESLQKGDPEAFDLEEYSKVGQAAKEMAVAMKRTT